ncbi:MAG: hypothetical protein JXB50_05735 [Spirochaetes bacterium]|nr:hypothetical protein [Spirochaetota bacterium]
MKRFNFKLEKLLALKEYFELEAKLKYAAVLQKKLALDNENKLLEKSILQNIIEDYSQAKTGERLNSDKIIQEGDYTNFCLSKIGLNNLKKEKIEIELNDLFVDLKKATKEKKTMEILKEKAYKKYKRDSNIEERKRMDDIAGQFYERNKLIKDKSL